MTHFLTQRGNTLVGFILGLVVGLTVALGVAVYVTKVPIPFLNKGLTRNADQDAAEEKKNKDWDPNAPLYGKTPAANNAAEPVKSTKATEPTEPLAPSTPTTPSTADPLGDLAISKSQQADAFYYFVQVGAFRSSDEAESQRAKLALGGFDPAITQREQEGKIIYRVRVGPYDSKSQAEQIQAQLKSNKFESALIRVQR
jgi:cell division protein FtsN